MESTVVNQMLQILEPFHADVSFVPQAGSAWEAESATMALGLREGRTWIFAPTAAGMGPAVPPEVVLGHLFRFPTRSHCRFIRRSGLSQQLSERATVRAGTADAQEAGLDAPVGRRRHTRPSAAL